MDEQMIEVRKVAAELLGYAGEDAVAILRGDFDDKWDCLRVGKEVARVMAGKVAELTEALEYALTTADRDDMSAGFKVSCIRDELRAALAPYPERRSERHE